LNGRSKADVLRDTRLEVAAKLVSAGSVAQATPSEASASSASAGSTMDWEEDWRRVDAKVRRYAQRCIPADRAHLVLNACRQVGCA
jgi:hypothetical protein